MAEWNSIASMGTCHAFIMPFADRPQQGNMSFYE